MKKEASKPARKEASAAKAGKTADNGHTRLAALNAITHMQLWNGSVKMKDVEAKLSRALEVCASLESSKT